ncbi:MAG: YxeA family protein [Clostridiales bacterium]|nr:YxeA family protein [Clostridiales bacterium]
MKKKPVFWIISIVIAALVVLAAIWFKQYYDERYVVDDYYYTVIPLDYDYTPARALNSDGAHMGYQKEYRLVCYNANGDARELTFLAMLDFQELYPPGTYVRVSASKKNVVRQNALDKADVPAAALEKINESFTPSSASTLAEYAAEQSVRLRARNTPSLTVACAVDGTTLMYTYVYSTGAKEMAEAAAELQDFVYRAQFRTDSDLFPELSAIFLVIKLDDGTEIFSQKYDTRVTFAYDEKGL